MALEEYAEKISETEEIPIFDNYKEQIEKIKSELTKFNLSPTQIRIFIFLGKYGSKTASEIFNKLRIPRTETYHILNQLQNRGIVTSELSSPVVYSAIPFDKALFMLINAEKERVTALAKKEEDLTTLWETIPTISNTSLETKKEQLQMLKGIIHINSKIRHMIEGTENDFEVFCTVKDLANFYHHDITKLLSKSHKNVRYLISNTNKVPQFFKDDDKNKVKIINHTKARNQCFVVRDNEEILIFIKNANSHPRDMVAAWTNSKLFVDAMQMLFECCWEKAVDTKNAMWSGHKFDLRV